MSSIKETKKKATGNRPLWRLYVGLGNPGDAYANTYHNVGRQCLDALWGGRDPIPWKTIKGKPFLLAQKGGVYYAVLTGYMNASGPALKSVSAYAKFHSTRYWYATTTPIWRWESLKLFPISAQPDTRAFNPLLIRSARRISGAAKSASAPLPKRCGRKRRSLCSKK